MGATGVFATAGVAAYLAAQSASSTYVTAAVYDVTTGTTSLYRPTVTLTTASVVKLDILELLLADAQGSGTPLTTTQQTLATKMIEESTDNAASALWTAVGGAPAIGAFDQKAGLTSTNPSAWWGLTTTSALDQVRLLERVALSNTLLTDTSRTYALGLMTHVESDEAWGITTGVPSGVTVALKNGWNPITGIWEINSVGWVDGDGRDYLVAVLSFGKRTAVAGAQVVNGLSPLLWAAMAPASS
ncbi:MAG: serine hydrolase [Acidimicrobiales bacterium]